METAEHTLNSRRCSCCGRYYGDPLYATGEVCLDCRLAEWIRERRIAWQEGDWSLLDAALMLLCEGFTERDAASMLGVARQTVRNWMSAMRSGLTKVPLWLREEAGRLARDRQDRRVSREERRDRIVARNRQALRGPVCVWPARVRGQIIVRIPRGMRRDSCQEAWVAELEGRDPNAAIIAHVARETRLLQRQSIA